jgi:UDP-2-acetamido-2-deoxy-ribo-hexuluronate aminotransferase
MQFIDLKTQYKRIESSLHQRMNKIFEATSFIMGPQISEVESVLSKYVGTKYCISCSSGTDALILGLMAKGVGPGDAVFTTPFTFFATAEAISFLGATPIFVDIDKKTYNIDTELLKKAIQNLKTGAQKGLKPKAIIAVDLFGLSADYDVINSIAKENNLFVIEDAAQSFGGVYKGKKCCALSEITATSFFPAKPLGCYGDGGAVFTDSDELNDVMCSLRIHGKGKDQYDNIRIGLNARFDSIQAAVILSKMEIFDEEVALRQNVAKKYTENLKDVCITPYIPAGYQSVWAQYSVQVNDRDNVVKKMKETGIPVMVYYPKPLHLQGAFSSLGYKSGSMPVSEEIAGKILSLPMHPYLQDDDQNKIIETFKSIVK